MTATEIINRLLPGDPAPALKLARVFNRTELAFAAAGKGTPSLDRDCEFNTLKLRILAPAGARDEALAHYMRATEFAAGDARVQPSLVAIIIKTFRRDRPVLSSVVDRLPMVGIATTAGSHGAASGMVCRLLQADAEIMQDLHSAAAASIKRATMLAGTADLPPFVQA